MNNLEQAYLDLLKPSDALIRDMKSLDGDILILGAGGKMGPALAQLAKQANDASGMNKRIMAASRFSEPALRKELNKLGIETFAVDLLEEDQLNQLPEVKNVLFLAGQKFGTSGKEPSTWAMNAYVPGCVAKKFHRSRVVVFSTGNVYPLSPVSGRGLSEHDATGPIGEYAQSCLARERIFQYASQKYNNPVFIYRLNYAIDVHYGVLVDIAKSVYEEIPLDLSMGHVNVIWQGEANERAIRALLYCDAPAKIVNITGLETLSVRWIAHEFGKLFGVEPVFKNKEQATALLSDASYSVRLFGDLQVSIDRMIEIVAAWVMQGGMTIDKPTHFQEREGHF